MAEKITQLNIRFLETYKSLESLCSEVYDSADSEKRGVSRYIELMESVPEWESDGLGGFKDDYYRLKHLRHVRNQFAHEPDTMNLPLCTDADIDYLMKFRNRILTSADPLGRVFKERKRRKAQVSPGRQGPAVSAASHGPEGKDRRIVPFVTIFLIIINVAVFFTLLLIDPEGEYVWEKLSDSYESVFASGMWWRIFTSMFCHGDSLHLLDNMASLACIGIALEAGRRGRFTFAYFLSGVGAALASALIHNFLGEPVYSVGASGCIFGLIGYYVGLIIVSGNFKIVSLVRPAIAVILLIYPSFGDAMIDNWGHIGGLVTGLVLGLVFESFAKKR